MGSRWGIGLFLELLEGRADGDWWGLSGTVKFHVLGLGKGDHVDPMSANV